MFRNMQRHLGFARSRHRLCAGASISPETLRFFDIVGRPVSQGYGLTESGGVAFIQTDRHHRIGGCGLPMSQTEWKLDTDGEILLKNPGVFKGYFLDEKASTASLEPGGEPAPEVRFPRNIHAGLKPGCAFEGGIRSSGLALGGSGFRP